MTVKGYCGHGIRINNKHKKPAVMEEKPSKGLSLKTDSHRLKAIWRLCLSVCESASFYTLTFLISKWKYLLLLIVIEKSDRNMYPVPGLTSTYLSYSEAEAGRFIAQK